MISELVYGEKYCIDTVLWYLLNFMFYSVSSEYFFIFIVRWTLGIQFAQEIVYWPNYLLITCKAWFMRWRLGTELSTELTGCCNKRHQSWTQPKFKSREISFVLILLLSYPMFKKFTQSTAMRPVIRRLKWDSILLWANAISWDWDDPTVTGGLSS